MGLPFGDSALDVAYPACHRVETRGYSQDLVQVAAQESFLDPHFCCCLPAVPGGDGNLAEVSASLLSQFFLGNPLELSPNGELDVAPLSKARGESGLGSTGAPAQHVLHGCPWADSADSHTNASTGTSWLLEPTCFEPLPDSLAPSLGLDLTNSMSADYAATKDQSRDYGVYQGPTDNPEGLIHQISFTANLVPQEFNITDQFTLSNSLPSKTTSPSGLELNSGSAAESIASDAARTHPIAAQVTSDSTHRTFSKRGGPYRCTEPGCGKLWATPSKLG